MISYPLDFNKPFHVFADIPQQRVMGIQGYAKGITTMEKGKYGSMECFVTLHYRDIPLNDQQKRWVRLARKHKDHGLEHEIYARAIAALKDKHKRNG